MNGRYGPNEMVAKHDLNEMNCAAEKRRHIHIPKPKEMHFEITRISTSTFLICLNYKICSHCDFFRTLAYSCCWSFYFATFFSPFLLLELDW